MAVAPRAVPLVMNGGTLLILRVSAVASGAVAGVTGAVLVRWMEQYDAIYFPSVEDGTRAVYPANLFVYGATIAFALFAAITVAVAMGLLCGRRGSKRLGTTRGGLLRLWLGASIAGAVVTTIVTSVFLAAPFLMSALLAAGCVASALTKEPSTDGAL